MDKPSAAWQCAALTPAALLLITLGSSARASLEDSIAASDDPGRNLARLVATLRRLQTRGAADDNLAEVTELLDAATVRSSDVLRGLHAMLPEVVRQHAIRARAVPAQSSNTTAARMRARKPHPAAARRESPAKSGASGRFGAAAVRGVGSTQYSGVQWLSGGTGYQPSTDLWLQTWIDDAAQDDVDGLNGFDASSKGVTLGVDYGLSASFTAGASVGWFDGEVDSAQFGEDRQSADEASLTLLYSKGRHALSAAVSRVEVDTERERLIIIASDAGPRRFSLDSDIESAQTAWSLGYSSYFTADPGFTWSPFVAATYAKLDTDDYIERGGGALSLQVETDEEEQFVGSVGAVLSWLHPRRNWLISPSASFAFEHDFKADPTTTLSRFRDTRLTFRTRGYDIEENRWRLGLGLSLLHSNGFGVSLSYEGHRKGDYRYDAAIINVQARL